MSRADAAVDMRENKRIRAQATWPARAGVACAEARDRAGALEKARVDGRP